MFQCYFLSSSHPLLLGATLLHSCRRLLHYPTIMAWENFSDRLVFSLNQPSTFRVSFFSSQVPKFQEGFKLIIQAAHKYPNPQSFWTPERSFFLTLVKCDVDLWLIWPTSRCHLRVKAFKNCGFFSFFPLCQSSDQPTKMTSQKNKFVVLSHWDIQAICYGSIIQPTLTNTSILHAPSPLPYSEVPMLTYKSCFLSHTTLSPAPAQKPSLSFPFLITSGVEDKVNNLQFLKHIKTTSC